MKSIFRILILIIVFLLFCNLLVFADEEQILNFYIFNFMNYFSIENLNLSFNYNNIYYNSSLLYFLNGVKIELISFYIDNIALTFYLNAGKMILNRKINGNINSDLGFSNLFKVELNFGLYFKLFNLNFGNKDFKIYSGVEIGELIINTPDSISDDVLINSFPLKFRLIAFAGNEVRCFINLTYVNEAYNNFCINLFNLNNSRYINKEYLSFEVGLVIPVWVMFLFYNWFT